MIPPSRQIESAEPEEPAATNVRQGDKVVDVHFRNGAADRAWEAEKERIRTRAMRLLRLALEYSKNNPASGIVPSWRELKKIAELQGSSYNSEEWMAVTDALVACGAIDKKVGSNTLLIGRYTTLLDLYVALAERQVTPLAQAKGSDDEKTIQNATERYGSGTPENTSESLQQAVQKLRRAA